MGMFRPTFRDVAQSLTDIDLILVEEAFERLLLDYDRVFSAMAIPACLWRRTGEIYKGNQEFADMIGVSVDKLRDVREKKKKKLNRKQTCIFSRDICVFMK
jgi:PAS domain-containing protein